jgi:general secretion pathway protein G
MKNPVFVLRRNQSAYTLVEIMLVLAIISVLVGSAIFLLANNVDAAKEQRVETDFQAITTQLKTYEMRNFNVPTTEQGLEALVVRPTIKPEPRKWMKLMDSVPLDPWGNPYLYRSPGKFNPAFDLYSWGPDKKESSDDLYYKK